MLKQTAKVRDQRLRELGGLLGPLLENPREALTKRLLDDPELRRGIRNRYEQGVAAGKLPALSKLLAGLTDDQVDEFFRTGWARVVLSPVGTEGESCGDARLDQIVGLRHEAPREHGSPQLARLGELMSRGLQKLAGEEYGRARQYPDASGERPACVQEGAASYGKAYPVKIENIEQTFWLRLDDLGLLQQCGDEVDVTDEALRADTAMLAALTALEARPAEVGEVRKALTETMSVGPHEPHPRATITSRRLPRVLRSSRHRRTLDLVFLLLRHHRPGFDHLPAHEKARAVVQTCTHVNGFLESLRKLGAYLEHGAVGRGTISATREVERAVRAAVLKDVYRLTYREIGEELDIPLTGRSAEKGDHATVRKMVGRGRRILERALDDGDWYRRADEMRASVRHR